MSELNETLQRIDVDDDGASYEKAKERASILWLLSKAYNNEIPIELRDPYYKDHEDQDRLKPQIVHGLSNSELYCFALASIYSDPNYNCLNHQGIIQLLIRKGIYVAGPHDTSLTETVLIQTTPIKMSAHMVIIEAIMLLYIKEVLIPEKVFDVVGRFINIDVNETPCDAEEAALFWINNCSLVMRERIKEEMIEIDPDSCAIPQIPLLYDLQDISDGCALATLLSFYCPEHLNWTEVCLNETMSMTDSIYNLQLVQYFCAEKLPHNICFLSLEDFLCLHQTIRPNLLAFIADLLFLFEIRPSPCVRRPGTDEELGYEMNGRLRETCHLTPSEMKAKSLQHTGWTDPEPSVKRSSSRSCNRSTSCHSDDDEEFTKYFSTLEFQDEYDQTSEMLPSNHGLRSLNHNNHLKNSLRENDSISDERIFYRGEIENGEKKSDSSSHLADYFSQIGDAPTNNSKKHYNVTTSFANLSKSKDVDKQSDLVDQTVGINIAFKQKNERNERYRTWGRDKTGEAVLINSSSQKTLTQLNDSSMMKKCLEQESEKQEEVPNQIASQIYNVRLKLEEKRRMIELERKNAEDKWKNKRQEMGKEAFLRIIKGKKDEENDKESIGEKDGSSDTSSVSGVKDENSTEKGFFISFGDEKQPKAKPPLRPKRSFKKENRNSIDSKIDVVPSFKLDHSDSNSSKERLNEKEANSKDRLSDRSSEKDSHSKPERASKPVGFVIGDKLNNLDPLSELEMAKKKEMLIMLSIKRKSDRESARNQKAMEIARIKEQERTRKELMEAKKEEEKQRRQAILEQYRLRKAQEEAEKDGISSNFSNLSSKDLSRNNSTILLNKPRNRPGSGSSKPRPKSLHVSASTMNDYASLDPKASRIVDDMDSKYSTYTTSIGSSSRNASRPHSSMSSNGRRLPSPTSTSRLPALPSLMSGKYKGPSSDGASDAGSTFSEYTGPKLFVKPTAKSNRGIINNAINVVLAGAVNENLKKKILEEINNSDSKHFLILFRGAGMQFRAIYSYSPETEEVYKLHGNGPKSVTDDMMDKFYKYNCGGKNFNEVQTKHLSVTIDAFTIHNTLWAGKRMVHSKKDAF